MKLDKIKLSISNYKVWMAKQQTFPYYFKYETLKNFNDNWNTETSDFKKMFETSLQSKYSGRLWNGERDSPKSSMIQLLEKDSEFMKSAFRDLFNQKKSLTLRIDRFVFHCDEVFQKIQKKQIKIAEHRHNDPKIISVYLSLFDPHSYCIFDYEVFSRYMNFLEAKSPIQKFEVERFLKICKTLYNFMNNDEELMTLYAEKLNDQECYCESNLMMVHDLFSTAQLYS